MGYLRIARFREAPLHEHEFHNCMREQYRYSCCCRVMLNREAQDDFICGRAAAKICILATFVAAQGLGQAVTATPDLILTNGRVFTAANGAEFVQAVAIAGNRIQAIGDNDRISALAGNKTRRVDIGGRLVIPGLNDGHTHMPGVGFAVGHIIKTHLAALYVSLGRTRPGVFDCGAERLAFAAQFRDKRGGWAVSLGVH